MEGAGFTILSQHIVTYRLLPDLEFLIEQLILPLRILISCIVSFLKVP